MNCTDRPRVSFGIPVRNGERFLARAIESIRAQEWDDWELVVSDNASGDATPEIAEGYAAEDSRVRLLRNERDIGQVANFNHVFHVSRGEYFRWIGADDYLEPSYTRRCVEALDAYPEAVGATTLWRLVDDEGGEEFRRFEGERLSAIDPVRRFHRALWFMQADRLFHDPIYSMLRRSALERTRLLPLDPWTDRLLAVELAVLGPFVHVDEILATRRNAREAPAVRLRRYHATYRREAGTKTNRFRLAPLWTMYAVIGRHVASMELPIAVKLRCVATLPIQWLSAEAGAIWRRGSGFVRRRLPGRLALRGRATR